MQLVSSDAFQVRYASNLAVGDSVVNVANTGVGLARRARCMIFSVFRFAFVLLAVSSSAGIGLAQTTGAIEGTVTDPTGAAIPKAAVKAANVGTGVTLTTTTNDSGRFLFEDLKIGAYNVTVSQPGFKASSVTGVRVDATARVRVDAALEVGNVQDSIKVEAAASPVQTADGTVSAVITSEQIGSGSI